MKTICTLLAVLFVGFTTAGAQNDSPLRFAVTEHGFGRFHEEGGTVSYTFEFTNTGVTPIPIDRVVVSCGCTTPEYPRTPVDVGASAHIKVIFDPKGMPGDFSKNITVVSGGGRFRNFLTITGHVIQRPLTVEEEFPHDMGNSLRVSTTMLAFRSVAQGHSATMVVGYVNTSPKPVTLALDAMEQSGLLDVSVPETICAGCRGDIAFTYDLSKKTAYGQQHDVVRPVVDGTPSSKTIYTAMTGIDDFEGVEMILAPRFFLDASFHDYGEIRRRTVPYIFRLVASNEGAEELCVRSVSEAEGLQCTLRSGMTIAPGASLPFEVIFYSNRYQAGEVRQSIHFVVNDPMRPTREIRISAIIK